MVRPTQEQFQKAADIIGCDVSELIADFDKRHRPHRRVLLTAGECTYCDAHRDDEMMPPHDASPRCESGGRSHCTCDTCF